MRLNGAFLLSVAILHDQISVVQSSEVGREKTEALALIVILSSVDHVGNERKKCVQVCLEVIGIRSSLRSVTLVFMLSFRGGKLTRHGGATLERKDFVRARDAARGKGMR